MRFTSFTITLHLHYELGLDFPPEVHIITFITFNLLLLSTGRGRSKDFFMSVKYDSQFLSDQAIMDCANGDQVTKICGRKSCKLLKFQGSELLHALGVETHSLDPELYFVPWILFNGVRISWGETSPVKKTLSFFVK